MSSIFKAADAKARHKFTYQTEFGDQWRSFAKEALAGKAWTGDCDDLASTTAEIAIGMGAKKEDLWFAVVSTDRNGKVDHMITIGKDQHGDWWVLGDTFGPAYRLSRMHHDLMYVHNLTWPLAQWQRMTKVELATK